MWAITRNRVERNSPTKSQKCDTVSWVEGIISNQGPSQLWRVCWTLSRRSVEKLCCPCQNVAQERQVPDKQGRGFGVAQNPYSTQDSAERKLEIIPRHLTGENMISLKVSFRGFLWLTAGWKGYIEGSFPPVLVLLSRVVHYLPSFAQRVPFLCWFVSSPHIHYINSLSCSLQMLLGFLAVILQGHFQIELTAYN